MGDTPSTGRLTARRVETIHEPGKYHDGGGSGLILRVVASGSRQWVQRIVVDGRRREIGLGSPPAISLAIARKLALENKGKVMLGGDPLADKHSAKVKPMTFAECVDAYAAIKLVEFRSDKHRRQWRSSLDRLAMPSLGHKRVRDIGTMDILQMLEPHWRERTMTAKKLRGSVEAVLTWATVSGHREGDNPAVWRGNLKELLPAPGKIAKAQHQPALALGDVARWWTDLGDRDGMAAQALRFVALTGARSGEVRGMTWDELDLGPSPTTGAGGVATFATPATWAVPATRMKNGREHRVPLTAEAVAVLHDLPRMAGSPYVFSAPRGGMLSDMSISAVMRRMHAANEKAGNRGYLDPDTKRPAVPHGLRATFRQWAAERGYARDMAEIALAHFIGSEVERAYQRSDMLERRRTMMADWGVFLRGQVKAGDVVKLGGEG